MLSAEFTGEQIREMVFEYCRLPYGQHGPWMVAHPSISRGMMTRWRTAVFDGDVDRGLVPRQTEPMNAQPKGRQGMVERRAIEKARHAEELAHRDAQIRELKETNELLGKAIGLLHTLNVPEPDDTPTTPDPTDS